MAQPEHPDWALILELGGPAKVARELNLKPENGVQVVHNWKYRGIPSKVKLQRPDLFLPQMRSRSADLDGPAAPMPEPDREAA